MLGEHTQERAQWYAHLRQAYLQGGAKAYWQMLLEQTKRDPTSPPTDLAEAYARVGDSKSALEWLTRAFEKRDVQLVLHLKTDPAFDMLRKEPEFLDLIKKMNWEN